MATGVSVLPEVFTAREIAAAAGVGVADARALLVSGLVGSLDGEYMSSDQAVRAVRILKGRQVEPVLDRQLFRPRATGQRRPGAPLARPAPCTEPCSRASCSWEPWGNDRAASEPDAAGLPRATGTRWRRRRRRAEAATAGATGTPESASALRSPVPVQRTVSVRFPILLGRSRRHHLRLSLRRSRLSPRHRLPSRIQFLRSSHRLSAHRRTNAIRRGCSLKRRPKPAARGRGREAARGPAVVPESVKAQDQASVREAGRTGGGPYRPGSGITPPELVHEVKPIPTKRAAGVFEVT
jgi:hypothetical protein